MNKNDKLTLNLKLIIYLGIFLLTSTIAIFILVKGITTHTTYSLDYKETKKVDYSVCLKDNNYYEEKCLSKNKQYIANLIDVINVNFNYSMVSSDKFNFEYKYKISADLIATERNNSDKVLYESKENLVDETSIKKENSNTININAPLKIDYEKYNLLMTSFKKDYILTLDSKLIVSMDVWAEGDFKEEKDNFKTSRQLKMEIPLTEQTVNIEVDSQNNDAKNSIDVISNHELANSIYIIVGILLVLLSIGALKKAIVVFKLISDSQTPYIKKLKKILNEYDAIIVESEKLDNLDNYSIIDVKKFEELVDAKENLGKPIVHTEIKKNKLSAFLIIDNNQCYRYILNAKKLEKEER